MSFECWIQAEVGLRHSFASEETLFLEVLVKVVERRKVFVECLFVSFLGRRKTRFVRPVVDIRVDDAVPLFNLSCEMWWVEVRGILSMESAESRVEDSNNFGAFVVHNLLRLLVEQDRHRPLFGPLPFVDLRNELKSKHTILFTHHTVEEGGSFSDLLW